MSTGASKTAELLWRDQTRTQSLFKCFFGMREDWGLGNEERAGSHGKGRRKIFFLLPFRLLLFLL